jgi:hypothetical protein
MIRLDTLQRSRLNGRNPVAARGWSALPEAPDGSMVLAQTAAFSARRARVAWLTRSLDRQSRSDRENFRCDQKPAAAALRP